MMNKILFLLTISIFFSTGLYAQQKYESFLEGFYVYDIEVADNYVWCATDKGVVRFNSTDNTYKCFTTEDGLFSNCSQSLDIAPDGRIFAAFTGNTDSSGVGIYDGTKWIKYAIGDTTYTYINSYHYISVAADSKGDAYATDNYIYSVYPSEKSFYFDGTKWDNILNNNEVIQNSSKLTMEAGHHFPYPLAVNSDDMVFLYGGKYLIKNNSNAVNIDYDQDCPIDVWSISTDKRNNFWFGSNYCSLVYYDCKQWHKIKGFLPDSLSHFSYPPITSVAAADTNNVWVGIAKGNLYRYYNGKWTLHIKGDDWIHDYQNYVTSIGLSTDGIVWFGSYRGLEKYDSLNNDTAVNKQSHTGFSLTTPYPNPFNASTTIIFSLNKPEKVNLAIYSLTGQKVRELAMGNYSVGSHTAVWDGRDVNGNAVSSGVYLARMESGGVSKVVRMAMVK